MSVCSASIPSNSSPGDLPRVQRRLVEAWAELHQDELKADWERLQAGRRLCRSLRYNNPMSEHPLHRVSSFDRVGAHVLRVEFADGSRQTIDFTPVLAGDYDPLQDPELFGQVRLDPEVHTLVWPNGADFDPATLHDWPLVVEELTARARAWASDPNTRVTLARTELPDFPTPSRRRRSSNATYELAVGTKSVAASVVLVSCEILSVLMILRRNWA